LPARPQAVAIVFVHGKGACRGDKPKAPHFDVAQQPHAQGFVAHAEDSAFNPARHSRELAAAAGCGLWLTPGRPSTLPHSASTRRATARVCRAS